MYEKLKNGYVAEELFVVECLKRNIPISRPIFNVEPYDFICEINGKFKSIQVKKSWIDFKNRHIACLKSSHSKSTKINIGSDDKVDYLAVFDEPNWYIIPRFEIANKKSNISVSLSGRYGKYMNNFFL